MTPHPPLQRIECSPCQLSEGFTKAGQIIGMVATILSICVILIYILIGVAALGMR